MITIIQSETVTPTEVQWELDVNGKNIFLAKYVEPDFFIDYEVFKGAELLTEEEQDEVYEFMSEQII